MTDANSSDRSASAQQNEQGVLANLPRTRPQRTSRRRAAARNATAGRAGGDAGPPSGSDGSRRPKQSADSGAGHAGAGGRAATRSATGKSGRTTAERTRAPASARASVRRRPSAPKRRDSSPGAAPRQGFECDGDAASGPVQPPGAAELVASAAEIVGELAKAGLSRGESLLKDVVSRLPLS